MINEFNQLAAIVDRLVEQQRQDLAFPLLDFYSRYCSSVEDFEAIGRLALKHSYASLAVRAAESTHSLAHTSEELYIARSNLYKAYHVANEPQKALFYAALNLEKTPNDFETTLSYAEYLKSNNERIKSEKIIQTLSARSDLTDKQKETLWTSDSYLTLKSGNTSLGIQKYLHTDKDKTTVFDIKGMKRWNRVVSPGSTLYLNAEGGIGDIVINVRFFRKLRQLGINPILFSNLERADLEQCLQRNNIPVITQTYQIEPHQPWEYLMQLPIALNVTEQDLWSGPYLTPKKIAKNDLGVKKAFRIGIKCSGNPYFARDAYRSVPLEEILAIIPEGCEVYYLDKDKTHPKMHNLNTKMNTWDDTLDFISQMDLVISSCTSIAHAAGALGVSTIVYIPILEYYVWTSSRNDNSTPWYGDNFKLFRQTVPKSWTEPIKQSQKQLITFMENK